MKTWTLADVAHHWDETFDYDEINDHTDSYFRRFTDSAPLFGIPANARVLDIDARTGRGSEFFHAKYPTAHFTCLVVSDFFKNLASRRLKQAGVPAEVKRFDQLPLPLSNNTFDVTLSYETLEHVPWPEKYIAELVRVTKPGGTIVLTTPTVAWEPIHQLAPILGLHHSEGPHRMVRRRVITQAFEKAGCRLKAEKTAVLVPAGPPWLLAFGKWLEEVLGESVRRHIALRRMFVYQKLDGPNVAKD